MVGRDQSWKGLIVAGTHSSVGKSSISVGLMRCLKNRGHSVKPFKVGPDYIDPGHHLTASGKPSYNLDSWMCPPAYIKSLFSDTVVAGDICVIEGVMGLFDGADSTKPTGSTAQIAHLLGVPVVLVIDGSMMARSVAALVQGFTRFDKKVNVVGVIANRVNSPGHGKILKEAIGHYTTANFLGYLPDRDDLRIPERHLGLHMTHEQEPRLYENWASHIDEHMDVDGLIKSLPKNKIAKPVSPSSGPLRWKQNIAHRPFSVAIARDEVFHFLYQDTLDLIRHYGGTIKYFSPLKDSKLPDNADWVYFPGGYPELHAKQLSDNSRMLQTLKLFAESGGHIIGECGGLMYLGHSLVDKQGTSHLMTGVFDFITSMKDKRLTIGYRKLSYSPPGQDEQPMVLRGHEFHHSTFQKKPETPLMIHRTDGQGLDRPDGYRYKNTFAFYSHIYLGSSIAWWEYLLNNFILKHRAS
ncbi:Cobyrinic acid a,c-diamide synthetase [hydrothermal vent metagenome]|uniref:Cobyrinic acid a,c-diamide synthetase n=1 Tax=hydrothermal vent metagenome TaxID=652676 RepID=A0A3B1DP62_9ZZZZ